MYKHAIKLLVSHLYENAEAVAVGVSVNDMPFSLRSLLSLLSWGDR